MRSTDYPSPFVSWWSGVVHFDPHHCSGKVFPVRSAVPLSRSEKLFSPAVRCRTDLLLCYFTVSIHASGMSIPLSLLIRLLRWSDMNSFLWPYGCTSEGLDHETLPRSKARSLRNWAAPKKANRLCLWKWRRAFIGKTRSPQGLYSWAACDVTNPNLSPFLSLTFQVISGTPQIFRLLNPRDKKRYYATIF